MILDFTFTISDFQTQNSTCKKCLDKYISRKAKALIPEAFLPYRQGRKNC
jgi:hypothetical protein